jgi:hypothetical protein
VVEVVVIQVQPVHKARLVPLGHREHPVYRVLQVRLVNVVQPEQLVYKGRLVQQGHKEYKVHRVIQAVQLAQLVVLVHRGCKV